VTTLTALEAQYAVANGRYSDDRVVVDRVGCGEQISAVPRVDGRVHVRHGFDSTHLDDDLADRLAVSLTPVVKDAETFQSAFVGIVATSDRDTERAWRRFYENSMNRISDGSRTGYVEVHRHAIELLEGQTSVLDLGCSFGFLALFLARTKIRTVAADANPETVRLLARMSKRIGVALTVVRSDPRTVPLPSRSVSAVALLHVLEHTDRSVGDTLLSEALRIAESRVVVAVPYEARPTALYGHIRTFLPEDLAAIGEQSGWHYQVHDRHGGWLLLERPSADQAEAHAR
jgi:SAM-dependent methyltransferase